MCCICCWPFSLVQLFFQKTMRFVWCLLLATLLCVLFSPLCLGAYSVICLWFWYQGKYGILLVIHILYYYYDCRILLQNVLHLKFYLYQNETSLLLSKRWQIAGVPQYRQQIFSQSYLVPSCNWEDTLFLCWRNLCSPHFLGVLYVTLNLFSFSSKGCCRFLFFKNSVNFLLSFFFSVL